MSGGVGGGMSYTPFLDMEQMDSITKHFGIKRYRSVAAVCAIYLDAQNVETHLYSKLTSFCVNNLTHISLYGSNFG